MKVGFVGLGRIGVMHVNNLAANAATCGVSEIVLLDDFPDRAERAAKEIGSVKTSTASNLAVLLGRVDAVVVATPTPSHPALLRQCVEAGVPTLCEKPVASDLGTMRRVVEMVESHSTPVVVGFQRRFDPALRAIKPKIANGDLGDIYVVRSNAYDDLPAPPEIIRQSDGIYGLDVPLVFGNLVSGQPATLIDDLVAAEAVSACMRAAWIAFATSGDPGWPTFDSGARASLRRRAGRRALSGGGVAEDLAGPQLSAAGVEVAAGASRRWGRSSAQRQKELPGEHLHGDPPEVLAGLGIPHRQLDDAAESSLVDVDDHYGRARLHHADAPRNPPFGHWSCGGVRRP